MKHRFALSLMLFALALPGHGAETTDAVVKVGGCSGVCVDPAGIVLTAKHCHLGETETVHFPDREPIEASRVWIGPDAEDVVAYHCAGDDWPHIDVAESVAESGSEVWSAGYPTVMDDRPLRTARGKLLGGGTFTLWRNGEKVGKFKGNTVDFRTFPGWSGGPLFDSDDAVIGILSAGDERHTTFVSHVATKRAYDTARFDLMQVRPHVYLFGFEGCAHCARAWGDVSAGRFGRVLSAKGDVVETDRYHFEYVHVDTEAGAAKYRALVAALEKATGRDQAAGAFPAWHVAGRAAITTGYPRQEGFRRLGRWVVETLRLPVTIFEGATAPSDPGVSLFPVPEGVDLGDSSSFPITDDEGSPGIAGRLSDRLEDLVRDRIDARLGDDSVVGGLADVAVDRIEARIGERLGREGDDVPWGGGLLGSALAALELWFRRKGVTA